MTVALDAFSANPTNADRFLDEIPVGVDDSQPRSR
jgi:hypothetical protein